MHFINKKLLCRIILDIFILTILLIIHYNFFLIYPTSLTRRGFYCDDESLAYPFLQDTITIDMLFTLGRNTVVIVIICSEIILGISCKKNLRMPERLKIFALNLANMYLWLYRFFFGLCVQSIIKNIGKCIVGKLRPHFFDLCKPRLTDGTACTNEINNNKYITDYVCDGEYTDEYTEREIISVYKAFPSGHASLISFGMFFLIFFIQNRWKPNALSRFVQVCCFAMAWFVSLSRVMDYKHHWSDVLAGSLLGSIVAYFSSHYVGTEPLTEQKQNDAATDNNIKNKVLEAV